MLPNGTSGRLVNPGYQPSIPKPGMMNDSGMAPSLGGLQPPGLQNGLPGRGGGLARLMEMYGRPGRGAFGPMVYR